MALSSGRLVTSILSPRAGKGGEVSNLGIPSLHRGLIILVTILVIHVPQAWCVYLATGLDFREKSRACFEPIGTRLWYQPPTLPLYYEGKMKETIFPQNYVYVLRTTTTRHMVSFIDLYFHFLATFQT